MSARRRITLRVDDPLAPTPGAAARAAIADEHGDGAPAGSSAQNATMKGSAGRHDVAPGRGGDGARTVGVARRRASGNGSGGAEGDARPKAEARGGGAASGGRSDGVVWRAWSGASRVASYRLPDELLEELAARAAALQLPVGLIVTAALAHILDAPGEVIATLVDRADDARINGRREARRAPAEDTRSETPPLVGRF